MKYCYAAWMSFCQSNILSKPYFTGFFFHYILFVIGRIQDGNVFLLNILGMLFDYIVMFICEFLTFLKLDNLIIHFYSYCCIILLNMTIFNTFQWVYYAWEKIPSHRISSLKINLRQYLCKGSTLLVLEVQ